MLNGIEDNTIAWIAQQPLPIPSPLLASTTIGKVYILDFPANQGDHVTQVWPKDISASLLRELSLSQKGRCVWPHSFCLFLL